MMERDAADQSHRLRAAQRHVEAACLELRIAALSLPIDDPHVAELFTLLRALGAIDAVLGGEADAATALDPEHRTSH
jgi:hypothetical protein